MKNAILIILKRLFIALSYFVVSLSAFIFLHTNTNLESNGITIMFALTIIIPIIITILGVIYFDLKYRYVLLWVVPIFMLARGILFPVFSIGIERIPQTGFSIFTSIEDQTLSRIIILFIIQLITFIPVWIVQFIKFIKKFKSKRKVM